MKRTSLLFFVLLACPALVSSSCAGELEDKDADGGAGQSAYLAAADRVTVGFRLPNSLGVPAEPNQGTAGAGATGGMGGSSGAGGGSNGGSGGADGTCGDIPTICTTPPLQILSGNTTCGTGSCHGSPGAQAPNLDLGFEQTNLSARLAASVGTGSCDGIPIIDKTDANRSLLLDKIFKNPPYCGAAMPVPNFELSDEDRDCLLAWVRQEVMYCDL